jgi:hypothetical protein
MYEVLYQDGVETYLEQYYSTGLFFTNDNELDESAWLSWLSCRRLYLRVTLCCERNFIGRYSHILNANVWRVATITMASMFRISKVETHRTSKIHGRYWLWSHLTRQPIRTTYKSGFPWCTSRSGRHLFSCAFYIFPST